MKTVLKYIAVWILATVVGVAVSAGLKLLIETRTGEPQSPTNVFVIGFSQAFALAAIFWPQRRQPPARPPNGSQTADA